MEIEFLCPNGHKIHCSESQAGKPAKCPRCGVKFRIPTLAEVGDLGSAAGDEAAMPDLTDSREFSGSGSSPSAPRVPIGKDFQIEFLCPNGHLLHGPATLQGQAGECPDCGSRFRIPMYDVSAQEPQQQVAVGTGKPGGGHSVVVARESALTKPPLGAEPRDAGSRVGIGGSRVPGSPPAALAGLFAKLWTEKARGATIEIRFRDGEKLSPDRFLYSLSQQGQGVFAVKDANGTHTITVVPWDSIARITVQGVKTLPEK